MMQKSGVSRRGFVRSAAAVAAAPSVLTATKTSAAMADVSVAATIVRASHSKAEPHALRLGVRASVQSADFRADNLVFVVDPVPFGASASDTGDRIAESVRQQIAALLASRGAETTLDRVAVQVFGGVL